METETVMMPRSLTAENGAKGSFIGEFKETIEIACSECAGTGLDGDCFACEGNGVIQQKVTIEWTTIKEIYAKAVKELGE